MSQDRDPFELLPGFVDPEPDPVIMNATIAQSRDAFANCRASSQDGPVVVARWFRQSANRLVPAGVAVAAVAVALVITPGLLQNSVEPGRTRDVVADQPTTTPPDTTQLSRGGDTPADGTPSTTGTRMGVQPVPGAGQTPIESLPQTVSIFEGDGIRIGTRLDATALEIYLPDISDEQTIDVQGAMPGEQIEILSAFAQPASNLVAVHFRVNDVRFWRIYHLIDGKYGRDPDRSKLVSDAADRAEVERRLAARDR